MMIKKKDVVLFFNEKLRGMRSQHASEDLPMATDAKFRRWIRSGRFPDKEYYGPAEVVPGISKLLREDLAISAGIRSLRHLGKSTRDIANQVGYSESTVKRILRERESLRGVIGGVRLRHILIQALHADGWSKQAIEEELEVKDRTIRRTLNA